MPPRKGIVKSGNAGNSSKAAPKPDITTSSEDKPLFPPGSKFPLSLLNERCQKNGWEKPIVDTRRQGNGFSFVVTLSRINKKNSERESVRLEPHPPYLSPSALEARHWGATYALYRFCNGIQLNRVLPPGPRDYWNELANEHKTVPEHQKWMYDADPFAARKAVDERQAKAAKKREETAGSSSNTASLNATSPEFSHLPEVKMAGSLRELVEDSIKHAVALYSEAQDSITTVLDENDIGQILKQLETVGFKSTQAKSATDALMQASPLTSTLLSSNPPLQACIEFLLLHIPECDLPRRFLPSSNSSNPFVTSAHSGADDLKKRWAEDKAVKECGWPLHVVKEAMTDTQVGSDWRLLVKALNARLLGETLDDLSDDDIGAAENFDKEELEGYGGHFVDSSHFAVPLPVAPIELHVILNPDLTVHTEGQPPPIYLTSRTVAAYIRLYLISRILTSFKEGNLLEPGESFLMAVIRRLEEEWATIEDNGPPEMSLVLRHMLPQKATRKSETLKDAARTSTIDNKKKDKNRPSGRNDDRTDQQVREEFDGLRDNEGYKRILSARQKLPAFSFQTKFLEALQKNRCVVVVGQTGCGKTTQLPQFILDSLILSNEGSKASIIVTQPRRLSAIGVATRVSAERLEDGSVGYAIRGESKQSRRTKLLFCTTGVVLRRLSAGDNLSSVTHVVVDEVHERSVDGDILLLQLKEIMKQHKKLKVILMSATINHEIFVRYFNNAPLLTIPGFTHPVDDIYLEDALPLISYRPTGGKGLKKMSEEEKHRMTQEYSTLGMDEECIKSLQTIVRSDRIDFELIAAVVQHIINNDSNPSGILIFLPGVQEIRQCIDTLRGIKGVKTFPLHANLSSDEQRVVFEPLSLWKIIAATNVAETSITIDDVVYVIDCGRVKETQFNPETGLTQLVEQWVTRAAAKQRRGRAGRTRPGKCYKLYTRKQENTMHPFPIPEIKRVPLESISLNVKVMYNDVKSFLSKAIDPPDLANIDHALEVLEEIGAISEGNVTPLGQHLSTLPLDLRLGKMLILASIFQCLDPVLTVAACLSCKPLFTSPMEKREEANRARESFLSGNSDLLTDAQAYNEVYKRKNDGASNSAIRMFCEDNFISPSTIRDITSLRNDLFSSLISLNFVPSNTNPTSPNLNTHSTNLNLIKAIILGGLWPRVAKVSLPRSAIKFDKIQAGTIQRENTAKEYKFFDIKNPGSGGSGRVFLHPASVLFGSSVWKSPFVAYFQKQMTSKVFLRDVTEVPMYALLLFGGPVSVNHIGGGLTIGTKNTFIKLKAWPRIGVLVNQLRRLLDIMLARCVQEGGTMLDEVSDDNNPVIEAMLALLSGDGLTSN
ncbi:hypothetical protein ABKN59_003415 [Abortiporus biennis]